jgi:hypothetical protein
MKPHRVRQICGSRNPFTPSIALWQHFVLPCHHLRQARQLFTATETTESLTGAGAQDASPTAPAAPLAPKEVPETQSDEQARPLIAIRRGGASTFIPPRNRSIGRKANKRAKTTEEKAEAARSAAKDALDSSEDYEGMIVEAIAASEQMPPDKLPWAVKRSTHQEPMERYVLVTLLLCSSCQYCTDYRRRLKGFTTMQDQTGSKLSSAGNSLSKYELLCAKHCQITSWKCSAQSGPASLWLPPISTFAS